MPKQIDANTRFYIDIDIKIKKIIDWNYGQRQDIEQKLSNPERIRIFITKGQYNKLLNIQDEKFL